MNDKNNEVVTNEKTVDTIGIPDSNSEEEMIPKSSIDAYIQETINQRWADKVQLEKDALDARYAREDEAYEGYSDTMKESPEPWVDLKGYQETAHGLKISLDWNNAFIDHLRKEGLTGVDDDEIVHKYLSLLMRNVTEVAEVSATSEFAD